jgi:uracil-DNA glycosylase
VVILGQDPYHTPWAAMGLSFSVPNGSKAQPSLKNIFKELESDLWVTRTNTDLTDWAEQGVLLLNSVLTVRQGEAASHQGKWWENFTDAAIRALSEKRDGIVFILWGNYAIAKKSLIDSKEHHIITSPHPSPFSAHNGFFGSKPFSKTNTYLWEQGNWEIHWE